MNTDLKQRLAQLTPAQRTALEAALSKKRPPDTKRSAPPLLRSADEGPAVLSLPQERFWLFEQFTPGTATYSLPIEVTLRGGLDEKAFENALFALAKRHDLLRTRYVRVDDEIRAVVEDGIPGLAHHDFRGMTEVARLSALEALLGAEASKPFDLDAGVPLRMALVRTGDRDATFFFNIHHISFDGWSNAIFVRDLAALYDEAVTGNPARLPDLPVRYRDFAVWQRQWLSREVIQPQLDYWKNWLGLDPEPLELTTDKPRPAASAYNGAIEPVRIPADLTAALEEVAHRHGVTLYMVILAAYQTLLHRYSGQEQILVGSPAAGRVAKDVEGLIGSFVNTIVCVDPTFRGKRNRLGGSEWI